MLAPIWIAIACCLGKGSTAVRLDKGNLASSAVVIRPTMPCPTTRLDPLADGLETVDNEVDGGFHRRQQDRLFGGQSLWHASALSDRATQKWLVWG